MSSFFNSFSQIGSISQGSNNSTFTMHGSSGVVSINGKEYRGKNISVRNNDIYVDGVLQDADAGTPLVKHEIVVHGTCDVSTTSGNVVVDGNAGTVKTMSGSVTVKKTVEGNVSTMSGNVNVDGDIKGKASTMSGDIRSRTARR